MLDETLAMSAWIASQIEQGFQVEFQMRKTIETIPAPKMEVEIDLEALSPAESLVDFFNTLIPPTKSTILPSEQLLGLLEDTTDDVSATSAISTASLSPIFHHFPKLLTELRDHIIADFEPLARDIHFTIIRDRDTRRPKFVTVGHKDVPAHLQVNQELRGNYVPLLKINENGKVRDQIFVNPKFDTIIFHVPSWIREDMAIEIPAPSSSPFTEATHTMSLFSTVDRVSVHWYDEPYYGRRRNFIVINPKSKADDWEGRIAPGNNSRRMDVPVYAPWYEFWNNLLGFIDSNPRSVAPYRRPAILPFRRH